MDSRLDHLLCRIAAALEKIAQAVEEKEDPSIASGPNVGFIHYPNEMDD